MKQVLLALLIITLGVKIVTDCGSFCYKNSTIKLADQDEESKKEKEDNKPNKRYNEEVWDTSADLNFLANFVAISASFFCNDKTHHLFVKKPNTPPPDLA